MSHPLQEAPSFDDEESEDESDEDVLNYRAHYLDFESDEFDSDNPLESGTTCLNLVVSTYTPSWKARHGWREFFQNWRDEISESNNLSDLSFPIKSKHSTDFPVWFSATHPQTKEELGYIKFSKAKKMLELTNYNARLIRETMGLGCTTKVGKRHLAGQHGEGYKLAALALIRDGYKVNVKASGGSWNFYEEDRKGHKHEKKLCVSIKKESANIIYARKRAVAQRKSRKLARLAKGNIWEDVTFRISSSKSILTREEVKSWLEFSLQLDPPTEIIETEKGSLILDSNFRNKMFLKGILLEDTRATKTNFQFGYNLSQGQVNRDRQQLTDIHEQGRFLAKIWANAMEQKPKMVEQYLNMLQSHPLPADVELAEHYIEERTARQIWQHLLDKDPQRKLFYYNVELGKQDVEVIKNSLNKEPAQLPKCVWAPLEKFKLVRTPRQQQHHLLHTAPPAADRGTLYSISVARALKAALALDTRTKDLKLLFKSGVNSDLDLLLLESTLEINDKWLSFYDSHQRNPCWLSRGDYRALPDWDHFTCSHIVTNLYELVLEELDRHPELSQNGLSKTNKSLYQRVSENLRKMPIMITAAAGAFSGEIEVSWADSEGDILSRVYGLDPQCKVVLHCESGCSGRRNDLLAGETPDEILDIDPVINYGPTVLDEDNPLPQNCNCPEKIVSQKGFKAVFKELDPQEEYFPMVSRTDAKAFFGLPPKSLRPNAPDATMPTRSGSRENGNTPRFGDSSANYRRPFAVEIKDDDDFIEVDNDTHSDIYGASPAPRVPRRTRSESSGSIFHPPTPTSAEHSSDISPVNRTLANESNTLKKELAAKNEEIEELKKEFDDLSKQLAEKERQLIAIQGNYETQRKETLRDSRIFQHNLKTQKEQLEAKDKEIREALSQNELCKNRIKVLELVCNLQAGAEAEDHSKETQEQVDIREVDQLSAKFSKAVKKLKASYAKQWHLTKGESIMQTSQSSLLTANADIQARLLQLTEGPTIIQYLQNSFDAVNDDLKAKQKEVDESKAEIERLQMMDEDANGMIDSLRIRIQELTEEREILAHDLQQAEDDLNAQARLASHMLERRNRFSMRGVKRGRDESWKDGESDGVSKRGRTVVKDEKADVVDLTSGD